MNRKRSQKKSLGKRELAEVSLVGSPRTSRGWEGGGPYSSPEPLLGHVAFGVLPLMLEFSVQTKTR